MAGIRPFPFQIQASSQIASRFVELAEDEHRPFITGAWPVPYYQQLSAITGAGKTVILADAISQMRAHLPAEPIVLWVSKSKAVVEQTYANFEQGGKYAHFVGGFIVEYLHEVTKERVSDSSAAQLVLATVGAFNRSSDSAESLRAHQRREDFGKKTLWELLAERKALDGRKRPLLVVYDEGHNLSDQQTDILMMLQPDALLLASATPSVPPKIDEMLRRLADTRSKAWLTTSVPSAKVVRAGLVKRQIRLGGHSEPMEATINEMLDDMTAVSVKAKKLRAGFEPKAIYVCRTNVSQDDGTRDNHNRPFEQRKAPPILIWRHLVARGVDPKTIAVYCDLKFERTTNRPPKDFILFSGGDEDFGTFTAGSYKHIIFNLGLQEGWDDPACYFAYIDKSMGSRVQIEQVIGRVLRQPNAEHLPDVELNTASFFIRVDDAKQDFPKILNDVKRRILAETPEITVQGYMGARGSRKLRHEPSRALTVPHVYIQSEDAQQPLLRELQDIPDFLQAPLLTQGKGLVLFAVQKVGGKKVAPTQEVVRQNANRVVARWILSRAIQSLYPLVVDNLDLTEAKYDVGVELTSRAATMLRESAAKLVSIYLEQSHRTFVDENPYVVGPVYANPATLVTFKNALHDGYSDLRPFETEVAHAIDGLDLPWCRNPSNGGYSIPLLQTGDNYNFFPDFLIWTKKGQIVALDPKGEDRIQSESAIKLLDFTDAKGKRPLIVRLITRGKWNAETMKSTGDNGFAVWSPRNGRAHARHYATVEEAVAGALT